MSRIKELAAVVDEAAVKATAVTQLTAANTLSESDGYAIQVEAINRRLSRGEKRIGVKMGFTSRAKMVQMGVHDMIWGRLTDGMLVEDGGVVNLKDYIHPRCEPEVAFLLKKPLGVRVTPMEALAAVEAVAPAIEIIDSRYSDFKFTLADVVADNCSSAGLVVGPWASPAIDLANLGMVMSFDGRPAQLGTSAAILGHPLRSLVAAARLSAAAGEPLQAGWIVMAGGATAAEGLRPGVHVKLEVQSLGNVAFTVGAN